MSAIDRLRNDLLDAAISYLDECGSCGGYHPHDFRGDCRDNSNRFGPPESLVELWLVKMGRYGET